MKFLVFENIIIDNKVITRIIPMTSVKNIEIENSTKHVRVNYISGDYELISTKGSIADLFVSLVKDPDSTFVFR